jgi:hypothetical protein
LEEGWDREGLGRVLEEGRGRERLKMNNIKSILKTVKCNI